MSEQGAFGITWQISVGTVLTSVANVEKISFPVVENEEDEITAHDSAGGYQKFVATGRKLTDEFEAILTWDVAQATHAELVTLQASGASTAMTLADPDEAETLSFNALVKKIERMGDIDTAWRAKVSCRVNGEITIT